MNKSKNGRNILKALIFTLITAAAGYAQTTEFTYQGKLTDANGQAASYDFVFRLCASETASCASPLATSSQNGIAVPSGGTFTVKLDFGAANFDGTDRFLEIAVRRAGTGSFITLAPRQKLTSAPYAIQTRTANDAANLGGTAANQYVLTNDPRLSPTNYVQNGTTPQTGVNFNVGGTGTAGIFNAGTQFNLNNQRVLSSTGTNNLFAGTNSGAANTQGLNNSFFGANTGRLNTIGYDNSFFGNNAGDRNTSGEANSFFGASAGEVNDTGIGNSFFGVRSGRLNSNGGSNAFFGYFAGQNNTTGAQNTFVGAIVGSGNTTGFFNTFLGRGAGNANTTGSSNTAVGSFANFGANNLTYATAIGSGATVATSNTLVLGRADDAVQAPGALSVGGALNVGGSVNAGTNYRFGGSLFISSGGNAADTYNTYIGISSNCASASGSNGVGNTFVGYGSGAQCTTGRVNTVLGYGAGYVGAGNNNTIIGAGARVADGATVNDSTAIGAFATVSTSNTVVLGRTTANTLIPGEFKVIGGTNGTNDYPALMTVDSSHPNWGYGIAVGSLHIDKIPPVFLNTPLCFQAGVGVPNYKSVGLCQNSFGLSSLKTDAKPFTGGIEIVRRLRPVSFRWKENDATGIGLNADEVAVVDANLVSRDEKGEISKVSESSVNAVLINAVKEQQEQIERQQKQIDELKKLVCAASPQAEICRPKEEK